MFDQFVIMLDLGKKVLFLNIKFHEDTNNAYLMKPEPDPKKMTILWTGHVGDTVFLDKDNAKMFLQGLFDENGKSRFKTIKDADVNKLRIKRLIFEDIG